MLGSRFILCSRYAAGMRTSPLRERSRALAPGVALLGCIVGSAFALHMWIPAVSPLSAALILGVIVANTLGWPDRGAAGTQFAAKRLLRTGIALLGVELSLSSLTSLGLTGLLAVTCVVVVTLFAVPAIGRLLGIAPDLSLLIGVGYGICGASAIAAAKPHTQASEQEASYAIGLVAIFGSLSIFTLPALAGLLHLSDPVFGTWAGAAVHDVGQVVATASMRSDAAMRAAIVVKLARVALLAPIILVLSMRNRRASLSLGDATRPPLMPGFVVVFLGLATLSSLGVVSAGVTAIATTASKVLTAFGLAALGVNVRWRDLREVGGKPLVLGVVAWITIGAAGLAAALVTQ